MKQKAKREMADLCHSPHPEDGLSPIELERQRRQQMARGKPKHRGVQYAKEASRAIDLALAAECCRAPLDELRLHDVELVSGGTALSVTLVATESTTAELRLLDPLMRELGAQLRRAVAAAIHRRRTPTVRVYLLPGRGPEDALLG